VTSSHSDTFTPLKFSENQKSKNPSPLAILQYEEMRNEMVTFLLDYLVENGNKDLLKQYVQNLDVPVAA
jgi:hypothetical protein